MTVYSYTARAADGQKVHGSIEAESPPAAARMIMERGASVLSIEERRVFHFPRILRLRSGITAEERIAFFQELSVLLAVGIPVHCALERLLAGEHGTSMGRVIRTLHRAVMHGMSLSQAMSMQRQVFSSVLVGMVRAGEESGALDVVLRAAASFLTEVHRTREAVRSALLYPCFLLAATLLVLALMTVFVLPIFAILLADLHTALPLPTRLLLAVSAQMSAAPAQTILVGGTILTAVGLVLRVPSVRFLWDRFLLHLPILGDLVSFGTWQMILRILAILLHSGIRLDRAVALACTVTGNRVLERRLQHVERCLIEGHSLTQILSDEPYLPPLLRGMLAAGEEAGELEHILPQAADYCGRRAEAIGQRAAALAEPIMIVFVAGVIFFAVLSFLLPIFDAMDAMM